MYSSERPAVPFDLHEFRPFFERLADFREGWNQVVWEVQLDQLVDFSGQERLPLTGQHDGLCGAITRSKLGRVTVYRRFPRREYLVNALITHETQRFLAAVAAGIDRTAARRDGVAEAFVAAVTFARRHPLLRRPSQTDPGSVFETLAVDNSQMLSMGTAFIAREIHGDAPGGPSQQVQWVAEVFARLFATYLAIPPTDPNLEDDTEL